jgi:prepilin signal peptidase PulO-like enzyme (type II secretory pathway)
MFTEILGWLALGAAVGLLASASLIWVVRQIFSRYWLLWGLMELEGEPPTTGHAQARRLDGQLCAAGALCGVAIVGLSTWTNHEGIELFWSYSVFCALLLLQARIDAQTGMLPDRLTLPMLWLGLLFNLFGGWATLEHSVAGAATGYIVMWLLVTVFRWSTGREAIGRGDFKLSAAIGAWLGIWALPNVWLFASLWVCLTAVLDHVRGKQAFRAPRPFGPGLAFGGILVMLSQVN